MERQIQLDWTSNISKQKPNSPRKLKKIPLSFSRSLSVSSCSFLGVAGSVMWYVTLCPLMNISFFLVTWMIDRLFPFWRKKKKRKKKKGRLVFVGYQSKKLLKLGELSILKKNCIFLIVRGRKKVFYVWNCCKLEDERCINSWPRLFWVRWSWPKWKIWKGNQSALSFFLISASSSCSIFWVLTNTEEIFFIFVGSIMKSSGKELLRQCMNPIRIS